MRSKQPESAQACLFAPVLRKLANEIGVDSTGFKPNELLDRQLRVARVSERLDERRIDTHGPQLTDLARREMRISSVCHFLDVGRRHTLHAHLGEVVEGEIAKAGAAHL